MTRGKAKLLRKLIEQLAVTLDDETALTGVELFPVWAIGTAYAVDDRVQHGGTYITGGLDAGRYTRFMGYSNRRRMA